MFKSELVSNAFMLAARGYASQPMRKDGSSQLSHCVIAALTISELGLDECTVAATLLHEFLRGHGGKSTPSITKAFRSQLEEFMPKSVVALIDDGQSLRHYLKTKPPYLSMQPLILVCSLLLIRLCLCLIVLSLQ